jgi:cell division protein FtsL
VDFLNTKVIDNKVTTNADIKDLKDVIMEMKKENTDAHKEIKDMIYRMNRRNERQQ